MFADLAIRNVRRQIRNYLIYFVTVALSIALLFAVNNLSYSDRVQTFSDVSTDIHAMFTMVTVLSCLVTALVLSYATGFMLKLRRREFGMYLTLGMTRRNIQTLFACETGLLKEPALEKTEKHPLRWYALSAVTLVGFAACLIITYRKLMAAFHDQDGVELLLWLVIDLLMVFLTHFALSKTLTGVLLRSKGLKSRGTNTVVLRDLSGKMTMNSMMIGALATLLVFAIVLSNVAFSEKAYTDLTMEKDCPYDVMTLFDLSEEPEISMDEGRKIIEDYSPIIKTQGFQLYSMGETTLCSSILGYEGMKWTDRYMPLSQFNALLTGCGYAPVTLNHEYLVITSVQGICDVDFSDKPITLNDETYTWGGSSAAYPDFTQRLLLYFVVPDAAVETMSAAYIGETYTLENKHPEAGALINKLTWLKYGEYGAEEECWYSVQEYIRLYSKANAGTLVISALYVSAVFVCMALAILSVKTLSTLEEERKRFAILYRLGVDERMQKSTLLRQIGVFFLMPFAVPFLMTIPIGVVFGKVYEFWNLNGLSNQKAMETALLIALMIAGIYTLYFCLTYRIAGSHIICRDSKNQEGLL